MSVTFVAMVTSALLSCTAGAYYPPPETDADIEITSADLADIAASVARSRSPVSKRDLKSNETLSFCDVEGVFNMSGNLCVFIPSDPKEIGIEYILYQTGHNESVLSWKFGNGSCPIGARLEKDQKLYFVVHGFKSRASARWVKNIRREILAAENASVIAVDWSKGASKFAYDAAAGNTRTVARATAMLVRDLWVKQKLQLDNVHYIGHSLGGQTGGFFGDDVKNFTGGQLVGRITGLDPAGPLFESYGIYLNKEHAKFVDIIHTSGGMDILKGHLGITIPSGHVDFFPNGGKQQPGCKGGVPGMCSHSRASDYYAYSVQTCLYKSKECYNWGAFKKNMCKPCEDHSCGPMGHRASPGVTGNRYLSMSPEEPYCNGRGSSIVAAPGVLLSLTVLAWYFDGQGK